MKRTETNKKSVIDCFKIAKDLSRDEKKELIEKIHISILQTHERRRRELKRQGKTIWTGLTPDELSHYLSDTCRGD